MTDYKQLFNAVINEINAGVNTRENCMRLTRLQIDPVFNRHLTRTISVCTNKRDDGSIRYTLHANYSSGELIWKGNDAKGEDWYIRGNIFGYIKIRMFNDKLECDLSYPFKPRPYANYTNWNRFGWRCGIEVLHMKGHRTKDGKYKYEGITIKDLREYCKKNGIKGYTKLDKFELVNLLLKC